MAMQPRRPSLAELTAGQIDADDLRLLAQLADMYDTLDPVATGLVERIQFGITLDALHAEIAELQRSGDLVGVRSSEATDAQTVTFTSTTLTTMVTITSLSADRVRIDGWAAPAAGAAIQLRIVDEDRHTTADDDGRFVFEDVPRGLAQLIVRRADPSAAPVVTPSIEL